MTFVLILVVDRFCFCLRFSFCFCVFSVSLLLICELGQFDALEAQIAAAEERFAKGEWRRPDAAERRQQLLWFNSVVEVMTRLDALKGNCFLLGELCCVVFF